MRFAPNHIRLDWPNRRLRRPKLQIPCDPRNSPPPSPTLERPPSYHHPPPPMPVAAIGLPVTAVPVRKSPEDRNDVASHMPSAHDAPPRSDFRANFIRAQTMSASGPPNTLQERLARQEIANSMSLSPIALQFLCIRGGIGKRIICPSP